MGIFDDVFKPVQQLTQPVQDVVEDITGVRPPSEALGIPGSPEALALGLPLSQVQGLVKPGLEGQQIAGAINPLIAQLEAEKKRKEEELKKKRAALTKRIRAGLSKEEAAAKALRQEALPERITEVEKALETRFGELEAETMKARRLKGQQFAQRGLARSTFALKGQEDVSIRQQQVASQLQLQAEEAKARATEAVERVEQQVARKKEATEIELEFAEVADLARQRDFLDETVARQRFESEFAQIQMDSNRRQAMAGLFGSLAGATAFILTGCWVARAIFGLEDVRWRQARMYMFFESPIWLLKWYIKNGERLAEYVKRGKLLKWLLTPLFVYFAKRGKKWQSIRPNSKKD